MLGKEQNEAVWMATLVLSRGVAVPVAVHEAKNGCHAVPSRPLQSPGMLIFTAEYSYAGKRTQYPSSGKRTQIPILGNELKCISIVRNVLKILSRLLQALEHPTG
jgi:hypothetical protein